MKMKFLKPAVILVDGVPQTMFSEGDVQDLNPDSAERWRRRGVAVDHVEGARVIEPPAAAAEATADTAPAEDAGAGAGKRKRGK